MCSTFRGKQTGSRRCVSCQETKGNGRKKSLITSNKHGRTTTGRMNKFGTPGSTPTRRPQSSHSLNYHPLPGVGKGRAAAGRATVQIQKWNGAPSPQLLCLCALSQKGLKKSPIVEGWENKVGRGWQGHLRSGAREEWYSRLLELPVLIPSVWK